MQETVLEILYKYRKTGFTEVVLVLLDHLLEAALSEESGAILIYLLKNQGPAYTCRRYWDWFEPFILQNIQDSFNQVNSGVTATQAETNFRILQHIQKIKTDRADLLEKFEGPQPFLTWEVVSQKDINTVVNESKSFHVVFQQITTLISKSTPNPAEGTNENLQKVNRGAWQSVSFQAVAPKKKRQSKTTGRTKQPKGARQYGRGSRQQYKPRVEPKRTAYPPNLADDEEYIEVQKEDDFEVYEENLPNIEMKESLGNQDAPIIGGLGGMNEDVQMPEDAPGVSPDDERWSDKLNQSSDQEYDETYPKVPKNDHYDVDASNQQYDVAPQEMGVFGEYYEGGSAAAGDFRS